MKVRIYYRETNKSPVISVEITGKTIQVVMEAFTKKHPKAVFESVEIISR
jgi:hypothetical protein